MHIFCARMHNVLCLHNIRILAFPIRFGVWYSACEKRLFHQISQKWCGLCIWFCFSMKKNANYLL